MTVTVTTFQKMKQAGDKITWLTAYDYSFASVIDSGGVDAVLVGDSLGMVIQGHETTIPVTIEHACYHTECVARGVERAMVVGDMPFGSYQVGKERAYENAVRLMQAGAHIIKLEGGALQVETVEYLSTRGIAVCGHIGLTPQSAHALGGFKVQGRGSAAAKMLQDANDLQQAGASAVVLEAIPGSLAAQITESLDIATIGIGAGVECDGQVLVLHDVIGTYPRKSPKFCKNFMSSAGSVQEAVANYVQQVKSGQFPGPEHTYN